MVDILLVDPEDVLHFDDITLVSNYRLLHNMILQLAQELQPALQRPTKSSWNITGCSANDYCLTGWLLFFAKGDFQSEVAFVYLGSSRSVGCLVTDLRVDCRA